MLRGYGVRCCWLSRREGIVAVLPVTGRRGARAERSGPGGISGTRRFGRVGRDGRGRKGVRAGSLGRGGNGGAVRLQEWSWAAGCAGEAFRLGWNKWNEALRPPPGPLPAFLATASGRPSPPPGRSLRPLPPPRTSCRLGPLAAAGAVTGLPGRRFGPPPGDGVRGSVRRAARQATSRRVSAPRRQAPHR